MTVFLLMLCSFTLQAVKLKVELENEHARGTQVLHTMNKRVKQLQAQVDDFKQRSMQETQVNFFVL